MSRVIFIILILLIFFTESAFANVSDSETYTITIPVTTSFDINDIGTTDDSTTHGLPDPAPPAIELTFGRLVKGSYKGDQWKLTTNNPIGISMNYTKGAKFSITADPFTLSNGPNTINATTSPTQVNFSRGTPTAEVQRMFKFYPIITIDKNALPPAGNYDGTITFTIQAL